MNEPLSDSLSDLKKSLKIMPDDQYYADSCRERDLQAFQRDIH